MHSLINTLLACLEAGFVDVRFLRDWSERLIVRSDCPQDWLIKLTISKSEDEAREALIERMQESDERIGMRYDELLLGFLFLAHERRLITSEKFILSVFDTVDAYDSILCELEDILKDASGKIVLSNVNAEVLQALQKFSEVCASLFDSLQDGQIYEKKRKYFEQ